MIWIGDKNKLSYYTKCNDTIDCYCDLLVYPNDLILQGTFNKQSGNYAISVEVWTPDGNTIHEVVDSIYYEYYFANNKFIGRDYFVVRLKAWSPSMCANNCFVMRIGIRDVSNGNQLIFASWTDRYCIADCCDVARDIYVSQENNDIGTGTSVPTIEPGTAFHCGQPLIRLFTFNTCNDLFNSDIYKSPTTVYSGTAFDFYKVTNFRGRIRRLPSDIKRTYSYNCVLQLTESEAQWLIEGWEYFPEWKMRDLEAQMRLQFIYADDFSETVRLEFKGGSIFEDVQSKCCIYYKFAPILNECIDRQYYGCGDPCNSETYGSYQMIYAIPNQGDFFSEQGVFIGYDSDTLITWLRSQPDVTNVEEINQSPVTVDVYALIGLNTDGVAPSSIYVGGTLANNRIFGMTPETLQDIADSLNQSCGKPVLGTITVEQVICAAPVLGAIIVEGETSEAVTVEPYGSWIDMGMVAGEASGGAARINLQLENTTITKPDANPVFLLNHIIGTVSSAGRPITDQVLNNGNNGTIPVDVTITIDAAGLIRYSGEPTDGDGSGIEIDISNIYYNLN